MQGRQLRTVLQIEVADFEVFVIVYPRLPGKVPGLEDDVEILGMISIGINGWRGHSYPHQIGDFAGHPGLFLDLALGSMRWLFSRVNDAGRQSPQPVIGTAHQQHSITVEYNNFYPGEPQHLVPYMCSQLGDEFRSCHKFIVPQAVPQMPQ